MKRVDVALALLLIFACLAVSPAVEAQQPIRVRIGHLSGNPPSDTQEAMDAFRAKLRSLGYVEGQNLLLAADLVRLKVDAIFTFTTPSDNASRSLRRAAGCPRFTI